MLMAQFRTTGLQTMLAGECPPLQRLRALRGRSPRYACPLRRQRSVTLRLRRDSYAYSPAKIYLAHSA